MNVPRQLGIDKFHPKQLVVHHRYRAFEFRQCQAHRNFLHVTQILACWTPRTAEAAKRAANGAAPPGTIGLVLQRRLFPIVVAQMRSQHVVRNADVIQDPGGEGLQRLKNWLLSMTADGVG